MSTADHSALSPQAIGPVWAKDKDDRFVLPKYTLGWQVLQWTADYLIQPDGPNSGEPWRYTNEQARFILWWYALDPETNKFAYRTGTLRRMKGWGKDPLLASVACVEFVGPCRVGGWEGDSPIAIEHPAAWVQVAAVSREQTKNTMTLFPGMMTEALIEQHSIQLGKEIIHAHNGRCRIEAVTSSPRSLEGGRATFGIRNETHHWLANNEGHAMARVMARNAGKSRDGSSRVLAITNAHLPGEDSVAEREWNAIESGSAGPDFFYDSLEAPDGLDQKDIEQVKIGIRAARGDSIWLDVDRTAADFMDRTVTSEGEAMRFYWNTIVGSDAAWLDVDEWRKLALPGEQVAAGDRITLGFDGSIRDDSTALIGCRLSDGFLFPIKIWERPQGPAGNSWSVPRTEVNDEVRKAFETYEVVRMYWDPPYWQDYGDNWSGDFGEKIVLEFWTMSIGRMSRALERLHSAVVAAEVTHNGDETLSRHVGNAIAVQRGVNVVINKRHQNTKIDAAITAALAYEARNDAVADGLLAPVPDSQFFDWNDL